MNFTRLTSTDDSMYETAMVLYGSSFPSHEQRAQTSQREILSCEEYHFDLIYDEEVFVGMVLYWETEEFIYVEHFCIDPKHRNKKYGQKAMDLLGEKGKTVILEIDPPADDISIRRQGFYQRAGYHVNPFPHVHPAYHKGNQGHSLVVMSFPVPLTAADYDDFDSYLKTVVMGGCI